MKNILSKLLIIPCFFLFSSYVSAQPIIIDHTCTDLSKIPDQWIEAAKQLRIHYGHTSHGSQIMAGLNYLETYVDPVNLYARYDFYGTSDGRQVTISPSRIWDQTPPPPDLYQDDPTLPAGVVKQIDWAAWGAKTAFDWKVARGDEILQSRTFYSNYKPWQAIFLKGTGP